jgi:hypothetical protein
MEPERKSNYRKPPRKATKPPTGPGSIFCREALFIDQVDNFAKVEEILQEHLPFFWNKIFLDVDHHDENRRQQTLNYIVDNLENDEKKCVAAVFQHIRETMEKHLRDKYPSYCLSRGNVLLSFPSTDVQQWHRDYDPAVGFTAVPMVFFVPLSARSHLDIFNKSLDPVIGDNEYLTDHYARVNVERGHLLTFNGFAIHRGLSYKELNLRVHFYAIHTGDLPKLETIEKSTVFAELTTSGKSSPFLAALVELGTSAVDSLEASDGMSFVK